MLFSGILVATASARAELKVVTTIKPLHSLISNVMDGIGEPGLIIDGSISPHSFTMKPSHAKMLEEADVIFWIGEGIETSMEEPLDSIAKDAEVIEFMELDSIAKLKFREESIFGDHDDHEDHDDHDDHKRGRDHGKGEGKGVEGENAPKEQARDAGPAGRRAATRPSAPRGKERAKARKEARAAEPRRGPACTFARASGRPPCTSCR